MKIEEVIKIYDFLSKLDVMSFIGVLLLILVSLFAAFWAFKLNWRLLVVVQCVVLFAMITLYAEAVKRNRYLRIANALKTNLVYSGYYQKSFRRIDAVTYLGGDSADVIKTLKKLPEMYPTDFLLINMYGPTSSPLDTFGLRMIDPNAIEKIAKRIDNEAESASLLLKDYIKKNHLDTAYLGTSLDSLLIDNQGWLIGQDFFKAMIGRHGLMPIYNTQNSFEIGGFNVIGFSLLPDGKESEKKSGQKDTDLSRKDD
jgi:hypothetical protein